MGRAAAARPSHSHTHTHTLTASSPKPLSVWDELHYPDLWALLRDRVPPVVPPRPAMADADARLVALASPLPRGGVGLVLGDAQGAITVEVSCGLL